MRFGGQPKYSNNAGRFCMINTHDSVGIAMGSCRAVLRKIIIKHPEAASTVEDYIPVDRWRYYPCSLCRHLYSLKIVKNKKA